LASHLVGCQDVARVVDDRIDEAVRAGITVAAGVDAPQDAEHEQDVVRRARPHPGRVAGAA